MDEKMLVLRKNVGLVMIWLSGFFFYHSIFGIIFRDGLVFLWGTIISAALILFVPYVWLGVKK